MSQRQVLTAVVVPAHMAVGAVVVADILVADSMSAEVIPADSMSAEVIRPDSMLAAVILADSTDSHRMVVMRFTLDMRLPGVRLTAPRDAA